MDHGYCDAQASAPWPMVPSLKRTDNRSVAIDHFRHIFRRNYNTYELTMWDFAGQDVYHPVHAMFFTRRTIYIVCIDMYSYGVAFEQATLFADDDFRVDQFMDEVVDKRILKWIRLMRLYKPPLATHLQGKYARARRLADTLGVRRWTHHPRAANKMADAAANLAMDTNESRLVRHPTDDSSHQRIAALLSGDLAHWKEGYT